MRKIFLKASSALAMASLFLALPAMRAANVAEQKIGIVDLQKVFREYYKTERSTLALKQEASEMQKEREAMVDAAKKKQEEWQKLIDKAEDQAVSAEERGRSKKIAEEKFHDIKDSEQMIQAYDRQSSAKLQEKERQRRDDIVREIRGVLDAEAKAAGYSLVLDVSGESANMAPVVLFSSGLNDLTDNLVKELNAGAPATPAEVKDTKDSKPGK